MAFDLNSAQAPAATGGFDLGSAKPPKGFGQQLNESIADVPRQIGLTARYGLEGAGDMFDAVLGNPIRVLTNPILPDSLKSAPNSTGRALADLARLPQPQNATERVVGDATRMLAGAAVPLAGAAKIAQTATGQTTKSIAQLMAANPAQQLGSAAAAGGAGGYTRETGGNASSQLIASLAAGVATPYAMATAQRAGAGIKSMMTPTPAASPQIDIRIDRALEQNGVKLADLPVDVQASIRNDVAAALRTDGALDADAVRRLADYRLVGATPTVGKLTRNPAQFTQEENLMRVGANSKDPAAQRLSEIKNENNALLIRRMNEAGAATSDDAIAGAEKVMGELRGLDARARAMIGNRYQTARDTTGRAAQLDPSAFTNRANDMLDEALLGGELPSDVRNLLNKAALGPDHPNGMPLTVDVAEQLKTRVGELQRATTDMAKRKALGLVRQALDDTPLLAGQEIGQESIKAFNQARRLNRTYMKMVERTPALEAVRDGIEPDKFVQQFIIGNGGKASVADVTALQKAIRKSPVALTAVKEQITANLKDKALNMASDEVGNFSQSAYNKALEAIGDRKLRLFFTPDEVGQLKAIGRVASYEQVQPKGSAVNNSNTAAAAGSMAMRLLDGIGRSSLLSKVPFGNALTKPAENIVIGIQSKGALNPPAALAAPAARAPAGLMVSPAILASDEGK